MASLEAVGKMKKWKALNALGNLDLNPITSVEVVGEDEEEESFEHLLSQEILSTLISNLERFIQRRNSFYYLLRVSLMYVNWAGQLLLSPDLV